MSRRWLSARRMGAGLLPWLERRLGMVLALLAAGAAFMLIMAREASMSEERISVPRQTEAESYKRGVELGPNNTQEANPGETIVYHHVLTNTGTTTDTFDLEVRSAYHWPVQLLAQTYPTETLVLPLEIGAQLTTSFQVSLTIPSNIADITETTTITATSQLSPTVQDAAVDRTVVPPNWVFLPWVAKQWPPVPHQPTLYSISNTDGDGNYIVSWTELPQRRADTYTLEEATNTTFTSGLRVVCTTAQQSCDVTGKLAGTYYYRVQGHNQWGSGPHSNTKAATVLPPGTPTLNAIENPDSDGAYTVSWTTAPRATAYTLQEDTASDFPSPTMVYQGAGQSWSSTSHASGTYYYRVRASGPTGQGAWSATGSVTVRACVPAGEMPTHEELERGVLCCPGLAMMSPGSWVHPCTPPGQGICDPNGCTYPLP